MEGDEFVMETKNTNSRYKRLDNRSNINNYFVDGNAAKQLRPSGNAYNYPDPIRREEKVDRQAPKRSSRRRSTKELSSVNKASCIILIMAISLTLFTCIQYIKTQAEVSVLNRNISQMEKELNNLTKENKVQTNQLIAALDLDEIYQTATEELGMVRPSENQVVYFDSNISDFVKQYGEIPKSNGSSIIDDILE